MPEPRKHVPLLIVDDDKAVRHLLARVAERAGFDVDTARDGVQALEMLERKQYDIAIVDLMMPRLSGYDLVQKIGTLTPRPVVLVATALMNGDMKSLDDSMVRRVIRKPFDINAVANALIETARDIAEQRAAGTLPQTPTIMARNATVIADPPPVIAEEAKVLPSDGKLVPQETDVKLVPQETVGTTLPADAEQPPAATENPDPQAIVPPPPGKISG